MIGIEVLQIGVLYFGACPVRVEWSGVITKIVFLYQSLLRACSKNFLNDISVYGVTLCRSVAPCGKTPSYSLGSLKGWCDESVKMLAQNGSLKVPIVLAAKGRKYSSQMPQAPSNLESSPNSVFP